MEKEGTLMKKIRKNYYKYIRDQKKVKIEDILYLIQISNLQWDNNLVISSWQPLKTI